MAKSLLRRFAHRWHKRIGIFCSFFILYIAFTGFALNHTDLFGLSRTALPDSISSLFYGFSEEHQAYSFEFQGVDHTLETQGPRIIANDQFLTNCEAPIGVLVDEAYWLLACKKQLSVYVENLGLLDNFDASLGFDFPIEQIGRCDKSICVRSISGKQWRVDIEEFRWVDSNDVKLVDASIQFAQTGGFGQNVSEFNWERFFLDIHSGRIFGTWGVLFFDLLSLLFVLLAVSGIYMWAKPKKSKKRKKLQQKLQHKN